MKNFISVLIFGVLMTTTACQKDLEIVQSDTKTTQSPSKKGKPNAVLSLAASKQADCSYGVYVNNGMLVFSDANHFKSVLSNR